MWIVIEIKGMYDEDAKHKEYMFKKLYPDKKYITIGNPYDDFHPDIVYDDLRAKYENVIPNWETKCDSDNGPVEIAEQGTRVSIAVPAKVRPSDKLFKLEQV